MMLPFVFYLLLHPVLTRETILAVSAALNIASMALEIPEYMIMAVGYLCFYIPSLHLLCYMAPQHCELEFISMGLAILSGRIQATAFLVKVLNISPTVPFILLNTVFLVASILKFALPAPNLIEDDIATHSQTLENIISKPKVEKPVKESEPKKKAKRNKVKSKLTVEELRYKIKDQRKRIRQLKEMADY